MYSILVGSCRLILFICVYLLLCFLPCNLPILASFSLAYAPFCLVFNSFVLTAPVLCWCMIPLSISYILICLWCFPPLIGLLFYSLLSEGPRINRISVKVWVVSCTFPLLIPPLSPSGVIGGLLMIYSSLDITTRVHMGAGGRVQDWNFRFFVCI